MRIVGRENVSRYLKERRAELGVSVEKISKISGIKHELIHELENGTRTVSRHREAKNLSLALEINSDYLYALTGQLPLDLAMHLSDNPDVVTELRDFMESRFGKRKKSVDNGEERT